MTLRNPEECFPAGSVRLAHIQRVIETARDMERRHDFGGKLIAAAVYHDIGYAECHSRTGFHPVDGAVLAREDDLDKTVVDAVLHHSGARALAVRTRPDLLVQYGPTCRMMVSALSRALTFCDNRSGPRGEVYSLSQRAAEIRKRHAGNLAVLEVLDLHMPDFRAIEHEFLTR